MKYTNSLGKLLSFGSLALLLMVRTEPVFSHQAIKLFDATRTFDTGPLKSVDQAIPFASRSVILNFAPGDSAVISSTPDGKGAIAIDDFMTINDRNVCATLGGPVSPVSCFGTVIDSDLPTGVAIETVLQPIPPVDVSPFIRTGTTSVLFELRDFGIIAGNTDLFLVTTATVNPDQPPATVGNAIDRATELSRAELRDAALERFKNEFTTQIAKPILTGLHQANADPETIDEVKQQLVLTNAQLASQLGDTIESLLDGKTILGELPRRINGVLQELGDAPTFVENFVPNLGRPTLQFQQSIADIATNGFDSRQVTYSWQDIAADFVLRRDVPTEPAVHYSGSVSVKAEGEGGTQQGGQGGQGGQGKPPKVTGSVTLKLSWRQFELSVQGSGSVTGSTPQTGTQTSWNTSVQATLKF